MSAPGWLDELTLEPGPPFLSMGTRASDMDGWLVVDENYGTELALKDRLMREQPTAVFAARPDSSDACLEVHELVSGWMADRYRDRLDQRRRGLPDDELHPLDGAARVVQEDLCVMIEHDDGTYRLDAASVCFPSHWRLAEKMGRPVAEIHGPVHHYDDELRAKVDRFFSRLRVGKPVVRRNLSIHDHADLFRPEPHESPDSFTDSPDDVWLRSERQTLLRLPETGAIVFTIKTQQCRLRALEDRPDLAHALARKLRALSPELASLDERIPYPAWLPDWLDALP